MRSNWDAVRRSYIEGVVDAKGNRNWPTLDVVAATFDISVSTLRKKSMSERWPAMRNDFRTEVAQRQRQIALEALATEGADLDSAVHRIARKLLAQVEMHVDNAITANVPLSINAIKNLLTSLPAAVSAGHLAEGRATEIVQSHIAASVPELESAMELLSDDQLDQIEQAAALMESAQARAKEQAEVRSTSH